MANNQEKFICFNCGKEKKSGDFYYSNSPFHKYTGKTHVCKECFLKYVGEDFNKLKTALRMIDKPFLNNLLESSIEEAEKNNKNVIGMYMKNVSMIQYKNYTWEDSDNDLNKVPIINRINEKESSNLGELVKKWGGNYTEDEYEFLENFFSEYENSYATDTPVQINLYKNIAKVQLQAEKELSSNNIKVYKDLMELSSKLHNDGNIKPIQSTGANDDRGLSTYGLWIKTIEQDEPCEFFKNKPLYEDYDKLRKYWEKWFIRPFKNIFNISKDFNVKDDD